ncbi:MAG: 4a-hydroxytetrahydrobiopterin dehydratase [Pseudomonadota bacterium]
MPNRLSDADIDASLQALNGRAGQSWSLVDGKLTRTFRFADFSAALGFMVRSGLVAEQLNHHPEWSNVYATVDVALVTHDADGLTELDFRLANAMEDIAG